MLPKSTDRRRNMGECFRFQTTFLGSRAVSGTLLGEGVLELHDATGHSMADVLRHHGFDSSESAIAKIAIPREKVRGYVEVHLEQGPVLEGKGEPLALVSGIAGQSRFFISIMGQQVLLC